MTLERGLPPGAWVVRVDSSRSTWSSSVISTTEATDHVETSERNTTALLGGLLHNRAELLQLLDADSRQDADDAALALRAYERWGERAVERILGPCSLVIVDGERRTIIAARDRLGLYPLFRARVGPTLLFSNSIDALLAQEGVPGDVDLPVVVDHLRHVWPFPEETYFQAVRRVPPGNLLALDAQGEHLRRYWDPAPEDHVDWVRPDEIDQFDVLFEQAVARCMASGPVGIFLSGGLDSVSVAAVATTRARAKAETMPLALSLAFPGDANETPLQTGVASGLGLDQVMLDFDVAVGARGLLRQVVELSAKAPAPLLNLWMPAYDRLAMRGRARGCMSILTGGGGDEWLIVSPYYAADLVRTLDLVGLARLYNDHRRSHNVKTLPYLRHISWRYGLRPVLIDRTTMTLRRRAPSVLNKLTLRRLEDKIPAWLAPDPALHRKLRERELLRRNTQWATAQAATGRDSRYPRIYFAESRTALEHPLVSMEFEELYVQARRLDMPILQPFWDSQLVEYLYRVPPDLLNAGGRSKALIRDSVARRFPGLGFERQRKIAATGLVRSLIEGEGATAWSELGGVDALGDSGVVDGRALYEQIEGILGSRELRKYYLVWDFLALGSFLKAKQEGKVYDQT